MGIKKRNKVNAEFNMSSLTDIIFLLLIFFMLTSSLIQINVDLPKSNSKTVAPTDMAAMITTDGILKYNGKVIQRSQLRGLVQKDMAESDNNENATLTIIAQTGVDWDQVSPLIDIAKGLRIRAIMATEARKE